MKLNLKARFTNKAFVTSFIAALILLIQQLGLGKYLPENIMDIVNTVLLLLSMLGILIDPTTRGVSDTKAVLEFKTSDKLLDEIEDLKIQIEELENNK